MANIGEELERETVEPQELPTEVEAPAQPVETELPELVPV